MKRFIMMLLVAVCFVAASTVVAGVPVGDNISHVAKDGSYRDNARNVWVDACGKEHALCSMAPECPAEKECPEPEVCESSETIIALSCPLSILTQDEINRIALTTVSMIEFPKQDDIPEFVKRFSISAVIGGNEFRGVQARYKFFGMRAGKMDLSEHPHVKSLNNDPLDEFNLVQTFAMSKSDDDSCTNVCHHGKTLCIAEPGAVNGHLNHGDTLGECSDDPDPEDPYCGDGNQDAGETCDTCPTDVVELCNDDPEDPKDPTNLGWKRTDDDVKVLEALVYLDQFFKGEQTECHNEDGRIKPLCRLGIYAGGGVMEVDEQLVIERYGIRRALNDRKQFELTATIGVEYIFPFRLAIGAGYHTEAGALVHAGYGVTW